MLYHDCEIYLADPFFTDYHAKNAACKALKEAICLKGVAQQPRNAHGISKSSHHSYEIMQENKYVNDLRAAASLAVGASSPVCCWTTATSPFSSSS